jgi:hypothetical protein
MLLNEHFPYNHIIKVGLFEDLNIYALTNIAVHSDPQSLNFEYGPSPQVLKMMHSAMSQNFPEWQPTGIYKPLERSQHSFLFGSASKSNTNSSCTHSLLKNKQR